MFVSKDGAKVRKLFGSCYKSKQFAIFANRFIGINSMEFDELENTEWGCLIDNPDVIFKVDIVNPNGSIEYHLPYDTQRHSAYFSEVKVLRESEVPTKIKLAYKTKVSISQKD